MATGTPPNPSNEHFPCPGCSADMKYDPAAGMMKCPYCGRTAAVPTVAPSTTPANVATPSPERLLCHPLEEFLAKAGSAHLITLAPQALEVHCATCGSSVTFQPPEVAGVCPFCGSAIVAQPKAADPLLAPDAVLPAKISKQQAQGEVRQWLSSRWFAPDALKTMARQEGINGVYLPFWSYDADSSSDYVGERGEHYYETEYYTDDKGNRCTREVQRTRWYPAAGHVDLAFQDVLIAASRSVQESKLNALEPWGLQALCAYEPGYLAGFKAQRYQVELPDGYTEAKQVMGNSIHEAVRRDIGGDEQRVQSVQTAFSNVGFRHLLLPVWIGAYRFQNKVYQVVVNADTGEVQGDRPYSALKIALLVIAIVVAVLIFFMISGGNH
jgi:DNA-directed RNA polymerase subunit RPC12/RpoP